MNYWVPDVDVTGLHEMVANALMHPDRTEETMDLDLRGETLPGMEEEDTDE